MSDLLSSLVIPSPPAAIDTQKESPSDDHQATLQADSLVVHDVEAYLNDPKNKALMASSSKKPSANTTTIYGAPQPVQLGGPKTSHHVPILNHLCQVRNLVPQFEIEIQANGGFGGCLRIGTETVYSHEKFASKKEAKEALAEKGVELVNGGMVGKEKGKETSSEEERKNWVGLLLEYHRAPGSEFGGAGANFVEYGIGSSFACTCTIPGHDGVEFGSNTTGFTSKKAARNEAAKQAVQFLIAQGLTNPDGTVKKRVTTPAKIVKKRSGHKETTPGKVVSVEGKALEVNMDATYAQKVNGICPILGLDQPTYRLVPSAESPSLLSGAAYFSGNPLFPGPIGEVRNVYGKKSAKEECARGVWQVLLRLAKERGVEVEISSEEDEDGLEE